MDFLYDIFSEVLSEEGIWVLILIASAFAVASFILLTLRVETSPKQGIISEIEKKPQKEKKPKGGKKKEKETAPETEGGASEPKTDLPPDPQMTPPESFTHPEVVLPGSASYKNIPLPVGEQPSATATQPASGLVLDPFEVAPIPIQEAEAHKPDAEHVEVPDKMPGLEDAAIALAMEDGITGVGSVKEQVEDDLESESSQGSENSDIFELFESVDEEDAELTEFAKDLDDVAVSGLLTETEDLSQELKNILAKHGRRQ